MNRFLELLLGTPELAFGASVLAKATVLLLLALLLAALLRRRSAALRHLVWSLALAATVAVALPWPVLAPVGVELPVAALPDVSAWSRLPDDSPLTQTTNATPHAAFSAPASAGKSSTGTRSLPAVVVVYLAGATFVLAWALLGRLGLTAVTRRAEPATGDEWRSLLADAAARLDVPRAPRLLRSREVTTPLIWGALRPVILLPWGADDWPAERRRMVLLHELAHVARRDALTQLVSVVACALYWPHPLVWMAVRRQRVERERACDDAVLAHGTPGHLYAAELLELARGASVPRFAGMFAAGMARPSELEGRLLATLEVRARRRRLSRRLVAGAGGVTLLVALPLGIVRPELRAAVVPVSPAAAPAASLAPSPRSALPRVAASPVAPRLTSAPDPAPPAQSASADSVAEYSLPAKSGERLTLELRTGGSVVIRPGEDSRVTVRAELSGPSWRDTRVVVERASDGVRLRSTYEGSASTRQSSHRFEVRVPQRFDVRLNSAGGGLNVAGIEGTIRGNTGGGSLRLDRLRGRVSLTTGGGEIRVSNSALDGRVSTGGGLVIVTKVTGDLDATSGSGPVIRGDVSDSDDPGADSASSDRSTTTTTTTTISDDSDVLAARGQRAKPTAESEMARAATEGLVTIERAGGRIDIPSAPHGAHLQTGGGDIRVGRVTGRLVATTGGGDLRLGPVTGSAYVSTGAGEVRLALEEGGTGREARIYTGYGRVILELPSSFDAELDLETAYTRADRPSRIDSDWDLPAPTTSDWDDTEGTPRRYVRVRATIGRGGNLIRVKAVNGNVEVRKR